MFNWICNHIPEMVAFWVAALIFFVWFNYRWWGYLGKAMED